jgi:hypothetical protein
MIPSNLLRAANPDQLIGVDGLAADNRLLHPFGLKLQSDGLAN